MNTFSEKNIEFRARKVIRSRNVSAADRHLARLLKTLVDEKGQSIYLYIDQFTEVTHSSKYGNISDKHIQMIKVISPLIRLLCERKRYIDEFTIADQMYHILIRNGFSRNLCAGLLYAVFFSLNKKLRLSRTELKRLAGNDIFVYQEESNVIVNDDNIEEIEELVKKADPNASAELGAKILSGKIKKYRNKTDYALNLCLRSMNHGSAKAAHILGNYCFFKATTSFLSNDNYSKAYEFYSVYGNIVTGEQLKKSQNRIIEILNLGLFNKKMLINYFLCAIVFSFSFFMPSLLDRIGINNDLMCPVAVSLGLTVAEFLVVILGGIIRYLRPFFTQGWIVFSQSLIWFLGLILMIL